MSSTSGQESNAESNAEVIPVAAEWALWGKQSTDRGYHLLGNSNGSLGANTFNEVLTRYSPGTLEKLPQVTVSWLSHREARNYLGIAIHDQAAEGQYDADGREIVFTRYYCAPYEDLAAGSISYHAMYAKFNNFALPIPDQALIKTELTAPRPAIPHDRQAAKVAALLLTGRRVCIVGADRVDFLERLAFVDAVASLLPYGIRCRLSASTWASSTLHAHKFRLFFSSAPRPARDHQPADLVVEWGQSDQTPIGHRSADGYLAWLEDQVRQPAAWLAAQRQQMEFSEQAVLEMLERIQVIPGTLVSSAQVGSPHQVNLAEGHAAGPGRAMIAEELIQSWITFLNGPNPELLKSDIKPWRELLARPLPAEERTHCWQLIQAYQLLRDELPVSESLKIDIFEVLLRIAFEPPLSYLDYCEIEIHFQKAEGQPLHPSLLQAMILLRFASLPVYLVALSALDEKPLKQKLHEHPLETAQLIEAAANQELSNFHAWRVCSLTERIISERLCPVNQQALRSALAYEGYLAPTLNRIYPLDAESQLAFLTRLVQTAHAGKLSASGAADVLVNSRYAPTAALFATVLRMVDPADAGSVILALARGYLDKSVFSDGTRHELALRLSAPNQLEIWPPPALSEPNDPGSAPSARGRGALQKFWPMKG